LLVCLKETLLLLLLKCWTQRGSSAALRSVILQMGPDVVDRLELQLERDRHAMASPSASAYRSAVAFLFDSVLLSFLASMYLSYLLDFSSHNNS
ncbi:unnamed protein product, partial [Musa hybrid cultivar]